MRDKKLKRDFAPVGQQASTAPVAVLVQSTTSILVLIYSYALVQPMATGCTGAKSLLGFLPV